MTQYEPNHRTLTDTKSIRDVALEALGKFEIEDTLTAWAYWRPPTARWEDERDMILLSENSEP